MEYLGGGSALDLVSLYQDCIKMVVTFVDLDYHLMGGFNL